MKTINEIFDIVAKDNTIMYGVDSIDLIDENVPNTNASIVLQFRTFILSLSVIGAILQIIVKYGLSFYIDEHNFIMYLFYKKEI